MSRIYIFYIIILCLVTRGFGQKVVSRSSKIGKIIKIADELDNIIDSDAEIELLAEGFEWSEGPLWIDDEGGYLIFSDVPQNIIYKWDANDGISGYLKPSGYTDTFPRTGEPGSNGLLLDRQGKLILCQHGDRRVARMKGELNNPNPSFYTLANEYNGRRLNSPNDAAFRNDGQLYFTDPPYGLEKGMKDEQKELDFQGVYRLDLDGKVSLITKKLTRPNGLAFNQDGRFLYVANSDYQSPIIMKYELDFEGDIISEQTFFDTNSLLGEGVKGLPDGMKLHSSGVLFATGPGGILIIDPDGHHLGTISTGEAISNCAFDNDERYLYATSDIYLVRIPLKK